ncbi:hypothetical protein DFP72DRAFT_1044578 [Ephemerocybe angulata]|uniref:F-box domain-containing protein n=1 Tax=Ephemerocybe angulata TaxID=980116 RepID=A0A8H6I0U0_9AGAR|nr:hypothetical protein DFP72DRAFT_1044578 [Tulosesus angulatus]
MWTIPTQRLLDGKGDSPVEVHCERVEQRVLELEKEILALKAFRNTMSRTAALPAEILSDIFLYVAFDCRLNCRPAAWIPRVTHVCRQWRDVAISSPSLWTDICFRTPELMQLMLERSRNAPLTLSHWGARTRGDRRGDLPILRTALNHISRTQSIDFSTRNGLGTLGTLLTQWPAEPTPVLQTVILKDEKDSFNFPGSFPSEVPSLRYLELYGCKIASWKDLPLGIKLKVLGLHAHASAQRRPTSEEFLVALKRVPSLRKLGLSHILPVNQYTAPLTPTGRPPFVLSEVQALGLVDQAPALINFLRAVDISNVSNLEIEVAGRLGDHASLDDLFAALALSWKPVVDAGPKFIGIREEYSFANEDTIQLIEMRFGSSRDRPQTLRFTVRNSGPTISSALGAIKRHMDLSPVRSLAWRGIWMRTASCDVFADLPNLEKITLDKTDVKSFVRALRGGPASDTTPFRALESLSMHNVDFGDGKPRRRAAIDAAAVTFGSLLAALQSRPDPVPFIEIRDCRYLRDSYRRTMQELLPETEVMWHNSEMVSDDEDD